MLERALHHAEAYLASLPERPVGVPVDPEALRAALARAAPRRRRAAPSR